LTSWVIDSLDPGKLDVAYEEAARRVLKDALGLNGELEENATIRFMAEALELAVVDILEDRDQLRLMRKTSEQAFQLLRVLPKPEVPLEEGKVCVRLACLGILGDRGSDVGRFLKEMAWAGLPLDSASWGERVLANLLEVWLRLMRKDGWQDLDEVGKRLEVLRSEQAAFEAEYLEGLEEGTRGAAWELVALYHLAKASELLAVYTGEGEVGGHFDIRQQLEGQFDRSISATTHGGLVELNNLSRLLARTGQQLIENCVWTLTRAASSRVSEFVKTIVSRSRQRPIFEMLPPQRYALHERGLLGSGHRAIVVSLPTSSGKTFIAQFRILQAINQFDREKGWIAYLAPTRALVNQISTRLRRDFSPLGINVEKVSPALEVDALEAALLSDGDSSTQFRVLVTTPEKLDLMLRGGWEEQIGRPLCLAVVDEAHNIGNMGRGIKLELLLATINRECRHAQFLLLTPFINNADEIATWLAPESNQNIKLQVDWQPNDRAIVLSRACGERTNKEFAVVLETIHTTKKTLTVPERLEIGGERPLKMTYNEVKGNRNKLASVTAELLRKRGAVIVLAERPDWAWSIAKNFMESGEGRAKSDPDIELAQRYLQGEFGEEFLLCKLLEYRVGVHHAGLSDEAKILMEWLFERGKIDVLVATTTIAQGMNFPVSGVVMAAHQYPSNRSPFRQDMPPEDFWNVAGRAGRVEQGSVGIVALAAPEGSEEKLRTFVKRQVASLNSTLSAMIAKLPDIESLLHLETLYNYPEWSSFLQYLSHSYRQMGDRQEFAGIVENLLRGTFGFQGLRRSHSDWAEGLILGVQAYGERLEGNPGRLKLVDSTGFSFETVGATLARLAEERIDETIWDPRALFAPEGNNLRKLMGILLRVPELRENLEAAAGGRGTDGSKLASMIKDWVSGASLETMTEEYFSTKADGSRVEATRALTDCCKNLFGRLTQTASWGLAALQSMTFKEDFDKLPEAKQQILRNLPARVFYGVNSDEAIALRLIGVPRGAAPTLAKALGPQKMKQPVSLIRAELAKQEAPVWTAAMGERGRDFYRVWKIIEGLE